jgi:hypothetical protein
MTPSLPGTDIEALVAQEAEGKKRRNKEMIRIIWLRVRFEVCIDKSLLKRFKIQDSRFL